MNEMIKNLLGENYTMVSSVSLQATHLVIYAHIRMIPLITEVKTDNVATGLKGNMGNKGAVKVSFKLAETAISFITAHCASGQDKVAQRNANIKTIVEKFVNPP